MTNLDSVLKSKDITSLTKVPVVKGPCGLSNSHVLIWELDNKEGRALKNGCFWTAVWENTLESLLESKEIKPLNLKGNQPWVFIWRTDAEAPILWPPDAKNWLIGKDPDDGKDWGQEEKGMTEIETVGLHHWLKRHEFEQTQGDSEGQGSLVCSSSWGRKESDTTKWLTTTTTYVNKMDNLEETDS